MTRFSFITIAIACCIASYIAGRANPSDYHAALIKAEGYDAGRQSVIDELPKPKPVSPLVNTPTSDQCIAWWTGTDLIAAKKKLCRS